MRHAAITTLITAAFLLCVTSVQAQQPEGLQIGQIQHFALTDSTFAGPVEAIANTDHPEAGRGTLMDVFVAVHNHSVDVTASVVIELELRYADGTLVRPFSLGADRQQTLGPDEGVGFFIFWQIPADAPPGTATFTINATVGRLSGGVDGHADFQNPMVASDTVSFEVIP